VAASRRIFLKSSVSVLAAVAMPAVARVAPADRPDIRRATKAANRKIRKHGADLEPPV
jgi:hypothetical protein